MKNASLILSIIVITLTLISLSFADNYYVDAVNGDNAKSGTAQDQAWKTISYAISHALPSQVNPAIIYVAIGTYNMALGENFPLTMKNDIQLIGENSDTIIIDATGSGESVIYSEYKNNVVIDSFVITGGEGYLNSYNNRGGGGIYCYKTEMAIKNCWVMNNKAGFGSGIYCYESSPEITDCIIDNNTYSLNDDGYGGSGGGIFSDSSSLVITGCEVKGNIALWGGGFTLYGNSSPQILNCVIENNNAELVNDSGGSGGGIDIDGNSSPIIKDCVLTANTARWGGGINCNSSSVIEDSEFTDNTALWGGGIYCYKNSSVDLKGSLFENNKAEVVDGSGGSGGALKLDSAKASVDECEFKQNSSLWGSSICADTSELDVTTSTFTGNQAENSGAGIYSGDGSTVGVSDSSFDGNTAKWGGGLFASGTSKLTVTGSQFKNNEAQRIDDSGGSGGAIRIEDSSKLTSEDSHFENNTALWGGSICSDNSEVDVSTSTFAGNQAVNSGAGIYSGTGSIANVADSSFDSNTARWGGGLYASESSKLTVTSTEFKNNEAQNIADSGGPGGAININDSSKLTAEGCLFESNNALWGGGISTFDKAKLTIENCNFINNNAYEVLDSGGTGSGIDLDDSTLNISNSLFQGNTANWGFGINACTASKLDIKKCSFVENIANNSGGGVYATESSQVNINRANFIDNQALWGGGIYSSNSSVLSILNSHFNGNTAILKSGSGGTGGVIDSEKDSTLKLINCLLTNNSAEDSGGAVYHEQGGQSNIINCTLVANTANNGPAVYSDYTSRSTIKNTIVWNNGDYPLAGAVAATYSDIEGGYNGDGNINQDPLFTAGLWGDYYLCQTVCGQDMDSPCLNAGTNIPATDFKHNDYITRTDGVVDTGSIDMGFHYMPHVFWGIEYTPMQFGYKNGDQLTIQLSLETAPAEITADIYLIMFDPDGKFYSGLVWNKGLQPVVQSFNFPANINIQNAPLFTFTIPSTIPPVDKLGVYMFYLAALNPGTTDFISNIASTGFTLQ